MQGSTDTLTRPQAPSRQDSGNVLFIILVAVALFAALGFAVVERGSVSADKEQALIASVETQQCTLAVNTGVDKLKRLNRCSVSEISYELPDGSNENTLNTDDTSCFLFHPDGAGLTACGPYLEGCNDAVLDTLAIGQVCGSVVYAGISGGNRIYTTLADMGTKTWNNGTTNFVFTGVASQSDGLANTNTLVGLSNAEAPYQAALTCRALGAQWYLPAKDELNLFYTNKAVGALSGTFDTSGTQQYCASTEINVFGSYRLRFSDGLWSGNSKQNSRLVRCARR